MKNVVSMTIEREQLKAVDLHPLRKDVGRSGLYRVAMSEYLEKGKTEKENRDESREKK